MGCVSIRGYARRINAKRRRVRQGQHVARTWRVLLSRPQLYTPGKRSPNRLDGAGGMGGYILALTHDVGLDPAGRVWTPLELRPFLGNRRKLG